MEHDCLRHLLTELAFVSLGDETEIPAYSIAPDTDDCPGCQVAWAAAEQRAEDRMQMYLAESRRKHEARMESDPLYRQWYETQQTIMAGISATFRQAAVTMMEAQTANIKARVDSYRYGEPLTQAEQAAMDSL